MNPSSVSEASTRSVDYSAAEAAAASNPISKEKAEELLKLWNEILPAKEEKGEQGAELPDLEMPSWICKFDFDTPASFAAQVLALLEQMANEERFAANKNQIEALEAVVKNLLSQAETLKTKGATQLALGILGGVMSMGGSIFTAVKTGGGGGMTEAQLFKVRAQGEIMNTLGHTVSGSAQGGVGTLFDSILKVDEAEVEKLRAYMESCRQLYEGMKNLSDKARASMESIEANINQTRQKIVG